MRQLATLLLCSTLLAGCVPAQLKDAAATDAATETSRTDQQPPATRTQPPEPAPEPVCEPEIRIRTITKTVYRSVPLENKQVLGAVEFVQIPSLPVAPRDARIDSGAAYSSMHADNIVLFERDGQDWVRFSVGKPAQTFELPQLRSILIKTKDDSVQRRPVIAAVLQIGDLRQQVELNLTDRANFEYSMLVGRDFLTDNAIVDVSQTHLLSSPKD